MKIHHTYHVPFWYSFFQNDVGKKPQGEIVIDEQCRITRADGAATFEISTGKKTYYLTADSNLAMGDWVRVLQVCFQSLVKQLVDFGIAYL